MPDYERFGRHRAAVCGDGLATHSPDDGGNDAGDADGADYRRTCSWASEQVGSNSLVELWKEPIQADRRENEGDSQQKDYGRARR